MQVDLGKRRDETSAGKLLSQNFENILNKAVRSIGNIGGRMRRISMQCLRPCACSTRTSGRGTYSGDGNCSEKEGSPCHREVIWEEGESGEYSLIYSNFQRIVTSVRFSFNTSPLCNQNMTMPPSPTTRDYIQYPLSI